MRSIKKSLGIVRGKKDQIDARRIANYAMRYQVNIPLEPASDATKHFKDNCVRRRLRTIMNKIKTPLKENKSILPVKQQNVLENLCQMPCKSWKSVLKK